MAHDPLTAPAVRRERRRAVVPLLCNRPCYRHVHHIDHSECVWLDAREHMREAMEDRVATVRSRSMTEEEFLALLASVQRGSRGAQ